MPGPELGPASSLHCWPRGAVHQPPGYQPGVPPATHPLVGLPVARLTWDIWGRRLTSRRLIAWGSRLLSSWHRRTPSRRACASSHTWAPSQVTRWLGGSTRHWMSQWVHWRHSSMATAFPGPSAHPRGLLRPPPARLRACLPASASQLPLPLFCL